MIADPLCSVYISVHSGSTIEKCITVISQNTIRYLSQKNSEKVIKRQKRKKGKKLTPLELRMEQRASASPSLLMYGTPRQSSRLQHCTHTHTHTLKKTQPQHTHTPNKNRTNAPQPHTIAADSFFHAPSSPPSHPHTPSPPSSPSSPPSYPHTPSPPSSPLSPTSTATPRRLSRTQGWLPDDRMSTRGKTGSSGGASELSAPNSIKKSEKLI